MSPATNADQWNDKYLAGETPWDSGLPSLELKRVIDRHHITPCRTAELGCGSGTNAQWLAWKGFQVTGFDFAAAPLVEARKQADAAGTLIGYRQADLTSLEFNGPPFDFLFDRGCYHCIRKIDLDGFLKTLERISQPGTRYLVLAGNIDGDPETGIPKMTAAEICRELEPLFQLKELREFHFEDAGGVEGPLGWSCLLVRR